MGLQQRLQSRLSFARLDLARAHLAYEDTPTPENHALIVQAKGAVRQADAALGACCRFPPTGDRPALQFYSAKDVHVTINGVILKPLDWANIPV